MKPITPSLFEMRCVRDIASTLEVPTLHPFIRTNENIRIRYKQAGVIKKLNTRNRLDTARLYQCAGIIEGFTEKDGDLVSMWEWKEVEDGGLVHLFKTTIQWEDIELTAAQVETIASIYEYQKVALSGKLIRRVIVDFFTEIFHKEKDLQAA